MLGSFEYCGNCVDIKYILKLFADKICVLVLPEEIEKKMVKNEECLKNIKNEPFLLL